VTRSHVLANFSEVKPGRKRRQFALLIAAVILIAVGFPWYASNSDPRYQDRSLSYWFKEYCQTKGDTKRDGEYSLEEIEVAFRKMGTNALPYLLKEAFSTKKDTAFRSNLYEFYVHLPESWDLPRFVSHDDMRHRAVEAIDEIKPPATVLLPLIEDRLKGDKDAEFHQAITLLVGTTNDAEASLPYYIKALKGTNQETQLLAENALNSLGPQAEPAVPALLDLLRNTPITNVLVSEASRLLGHMGSNATAALPALKELFQKDTNLFRHSEIATDICQIEGCQGEAFDYLTNSLMDGPLSSRARLAIIELGWLGPAAKAAIPSLLETMNTTNTLVWTRIIESLRKIGAAQELYLPKLREKLVSDDQDSQMAAATQILGLYPTDQDSQLFLIKQIESHTTNEPMAISALGSAGTNAQAGIPAIVKALDGTNLMSWSEAPRALKKMEASTNLFTLKLWEKMNSTDDLTRITIAAAILEIDPHDHEAQATMIKLVKPGSQFMNSAIYYLGEAGPAAKEAIPALREALANRNVRLRHAIKSALKKIEGKEAP
jgi:HEAT repeat protein